MRRVVKAFVLILVVALFSESRVNAQEKSKIGMTFGFPASVGIIWHATDKLAIRPEFGFSWNSTEAGTFESDSTVLTMGVSALVYIAKWDDLSAYVSPRYTYNRLSSESSTSAPVVFFDESERVQGTHAFSGSFGTQYSFGRRYGAFGEFGLAYGWSKNEIDSPLTGPGNELKSKSLSTRTVAGLVFYF